MNLRLLLSVCFILCTLGMSYAQSNSAIDSLSKLIKAETVDTLKANYLIQLGEQYVQEKPDSALIIANQVNTLLENTTHPQGKVGAYALKIQYFFMIGNFDQAFLTLDTALAICDQHEEQTDRLELYFNTLGAYRQLLRGSKVAEYTKPYFEISMQQPAAELHKATASEMRAIQVLKAGKWEESVEFLKISLANYEAIQHMKGQVQVLNFFGEIYRKRNQVELALSYYLRALVIIEKLKDDLGRGVTTKLIAESYILQNNLDKGAIYAKQSLEAFQHSKSPQGLALSYGTLNKLFVQKEEYDSALYYAKKALEIDKKVHPQYYMIPQDMGSVGKVLILQEKYQEALGYLKEAREIHEGKGSKTGMMICDKYLGEAYYGLGNYALAEQYTQLVLDQSIEINNKEGMLNAYELLSKIHEKKGAYKKALALHQAFAALKDSTFNEQQTQKIADLEAKFKYQVEAEKDSIANAEKEKVILAELELEKVQGKQKEQVLYFVGIGLIIVLALAGFIYNRYRVIDQQKAVIEEQKLEVDQKNTQNELLLKEIHHRVKNNLQIVSSLLNLQTKSTEDETALAAMADGQNRVKAMALIHQGLYQNENVATIQFQEYAQQLLEQLSGIYASDQTVVTSVSGENITLDIDTAVPLGLILNELITNSFKYAFTEVEKGTLAIHLNQGEEKGNFELIVTDNGQGLAEGFDWKKTKSIGLRLVRRLSKQLYGNLDYQYQDGSSFIITFKDTVTRKEIA